MDQELIDEIESVFADVEAGDYLSSHDDRIHVFARDAQVGDFIDVLGDEYYIEHLVSGRGLMLLCRRVESNKTIIIKLRRDALIEVRRVQ